MTGLQRLGQKESRQIVVRQSHPFAGAQVEPCDLAERVNALKNGPIQCCTRQPIPFHGQIPDEIVGTSQQMITPETGLVDQFLQIASGHERMPLVFIRDDAGPCSLRLPFVTHSHEDRID